MSGDAETFEVHDATFVRRMVDSYNVCVPYMNPLGVSRIIECVRQLHDLHHAQPHPVTGAARDDAYKNLWWAFDNLKQINR